MSRHPAFILLAMATSLLGASAARAEDAVVARSGSITLTESAVRTMIERADARTRDQLFDDPSLLSQFVRSRLARMAILAEAKSKKWDQNAEVVQQIEQARNDVVIDTYIAQASRPDPAYPDEADLQAAYEANKSKFMQPRQYRVAQIFLPVPAGAPKPADEKAQKRLQELQQQARGGKADFAELARRNSEEKASAAKGGELDWLVEDRLLPQIRDAIAGLEKGGVTDPVRAPDGWHLIKLLDTKAASVAPLSEVREQLAGALRQQKATENANAFIVEFVRKNPVQLDEIELSKLVKK